MDQRSPKNEKPLSTTVHPGSEDVSSYSESTPSNFQIEMTGPALDLSANVEAGSVETISSFDAEMHRLRREMAIRDAAARAVQFDDDAKSHALANSPALQAAYRASQSEPTIALDGIEVKQARRMSRVSSYIEAFNHVPEEEDDEMESDEPSNEPDEDGNADADADEQMSKASGTSSTRGKKAKKTKNKKQKQKLSVSVEIDAAHVPPQLQLQTPSGKKSPRALEVAPDGGNRSASIKITPQRRASTPRATPPPLIISSEREKQLVSGQPPNGAPDVKLDVNAGEPVDEALLQTEPRKGLTDAEVEKRRIEFGYNELIETRVSPIIKFLSYFTGSIAYLIEASCILSAILGDWTDFGIILALLIVNACIGFFEEARAESAIDSLKTSLALVCRGMRNGQMVDIPARELVPGDIISCRIGDVIPADCRLLGLNGNFEETKHELSIDQSALTGESLPVTRHKDESAWSGTIVKQGQQLAVVTHTGIKTFLGRAAHLISTTETSGHFQQVMTRIGNFIIIITLFMVLIIVVVGLAKGDDAAETIRSGLILTVASIPVGLPTVLSVTMAVGAKQLAAKKVIVKRLTAVEEMAALDILCSDKTGTLTLNQLTLDQPYLPPGRTNNDLLLAAFLASEAGAKDAIELCVREEAAAKIPEFKGIDLNSSAIPGHRQLQFQPFDPVSKLTRATVQKTGSEHVFCVAKGAPHVILKLCNNTDPAVQDAILDMARHGLRALGVARSFSIEPKDLDEDHLRWELVGMLSLLDPPRPDSAATISACRDYGLSVKMITGDTVLIAKEVAKRLGLHRNILRPNKLAAPDESEARHIKYCEQSDGFAQVVPEDKWRVVDLLQKGGHMVGMTGDGVNDAPALKKANVGIAVHGCTDAARAAAAIVLLQPGLSTIVDGITTSRCIFQRMRSYAVYRITSTVHFMIFMFFGILALDWNLPASLIILIAILNDAATIVISVDNAKISPTPDKWRLGQIMTLSVVLGLLLTGCSFAHFFIARDVFNVSTDQLDTILYLHLSSAPHFLIFSTRLQQPFWVSRPSLTFFVAIIGTQIFAMFISIYGVLAAPVGWGWGVSIMAVSAAIFVLLDFVKVAIYKRWNFELTAKLWPSKARREKLANRQVRAEVQTRVRRNIAKARKVVTLVRAAKALGIYHNLPEAQQQPVTTHH